MTSRRQALERLRRSRFRTSFHLSAKDRAYIAEKGLDTIERHAADFVRERLAPAVPLHDGRQTPMRGHPVFTAQHATASCCRGCLRKWYRVAENVPLTEEQQKKIVALVMYWIKEEMGSD